jgi:hypothetical protein|tara:strand:+ start:112 stop:342 length:231 start_codon:yes stop_codon:yes gene_type:complete
LLEDNLLSRVEEARLKAVTDPFLDEDWVAFRNILQTGKDHWIMLEDPGIDPILIGLPSAEHAPQLIECAQAPPFNT